MNSRFSFAVLLAASMLGLSSALAQDKTLRIAMTASDIPITTGMPNNGFEGMRLLGFPIFEGLILFDLARTDQLATPRPGLAEKSEQAPDDKKTWIFHLRKGVKFHDGTDFNADAMIWNLERIFNKDSAQVAPNAVGIMRSRVPILASCRKIEGFTVARITTTVASYFPGWCRTCWPRRRPPSRRPAATGPRSRLPAAGTGPFQDHQGRAAAVGHLGAQRRPLGCRPARPAYQDGRRCVPRKRHDLGDLERPVRGPQHRHLGPVAPGLLEGGWRQWSGCTARWEGRQDATGRRDRRHVRPCDLPAEAKGIGGRAPRAHDAEGVGRDLHAVLVEDAFEVPDHCIGIEVRVVMELHAFAQMEDVGLLVVRRLSPFLGEAGRGAWRADPSVVRSKKNAPLENRKGMPSNATLLGMPVMIGISDAVIAMRSVLSCAKADDRATCEAASRTAKEKRPVHASAGAARDRDPGRRASASVRREAVEQAGAAGLLQRVLAAAARRVRRVPRLRGACRTGPARSGGRPSPSRRRSWSSCRRSCRRRAASARAVGREPVRMSCWFGVSPRR